MKFTSIFSLQAQKFIAICHKDTDKWANCCIFAAVF